MSKPNLVNLTSAFRCITFKKLKSNRYVAKRDGTVGYITNGNMVRVLKHHITPAGYHVVNVTKRTGQYTQMNVARFVAHAYLGLDLNRSDMVPHHKDKNLNNNHVSNLYVTSQGNHMRFHLGHRIGIKLGGRMIRRFDSMNSCARYLNCSITAVALARKGTIKKLKGFTVVDLGRRGHDGIVR